MGHRRSPSDHTHQHNFSVQQYRVRCTLQSIAPCLTWHTVCVVRATGWLDPPPADVPWSGHRRIGRRRRKCRVERGRHKNIGISTHIWLAIMLGTFEVTVSSISTHGRPSHCRLASFWRSGRLLVFCKFKLRDRINESKNTQKICALDFGIGFCLWQQHIMTWRC